MYEDDVLVSAPYGAVGLTLPQMIQKNANHAAPAIAGTERNRAIGTSGERNDLSRNTITAPSAAAITANRLCSHGSNASAAPVATNRLDDTSLPFARSTSSHAPIATAALPMTS